MSYKKTAAESSTITRDLRDLDATTGNIYETLAIISKRANQISTEMKEELNNKLSEFATSSDNLEEKFIRETLQKKLTNFLIENVFRLLCYCI